MSLGGQVGVTGHSDRRFLAIAEEGSCSSYGSLVYICFISFGSIFRGNLLIENPPIKYEENLEIFKN